MLVELQGTRYKLKVESEVQKTQGFRSDQQVDCTAGKRAWHAVPLQTFGSTQPG